VRIEHTLVVIGAVLIIAAASAQDFPGNRQPTVTFNPPELTSIDRGHMGGVRLTFRIPAGFHINSNQPKQDYLKKTEVKLNTPTDIAVAGVTYPPGVDRSFPFAPDEKLSVYTGDFDVKVLVRPLKTVLPQNHALHGVLKY